MTVAAALSLRMRDASNATAAGQVTQAGADGERGEAGGGRHAAATAPGGATRERPGGDAAAARPAAAPGQAAPAGAAAAPGGPGWHAVAWGAVGVALFSFSLPATRLAVHDLDPHLRRARPRAGGGGAGGRCCWRRAASACPRPCRPAALRARRARRRDRLSRSSTRSRSRARPPRTRAWSSACCRPRPRRGRSPAPASARRERSGSRRRAGLVAVLAFAATQGVRGIDAPTCWCCSPWRWAGSATRRAARSHAVRRLAGDLLGALLDRAVLLVPTGARRPPRRPRERAGLARLRLRRADLDVPRPSSPGTTGWRSAAWRGSGRSSSRSRC